MITVQKEQRQEVEGRGEQNQSDPIHTLSVVYVCTRQRSVC